MVVAIHRAQNDSIASSPNDVTSRWKEHVKAVPMSQSPKMSTVTKKSEPSSSSSSGTSPAVEKKFGPKIGNKSDNISTQRKSWKTSATTTSSTPTCNSNSAATKYGGVKKSTSFQQKEAKPQSAGFIKPQLKKISDNDVKTPAQSNTLKQNPEPAYKANLKKVSVSGDDRSSHSRHGPINSVSKVSTVNTASQRSVASYPTTTNSSNRDQKTMSKGMDKGKSLVSTEYSKASLKTVSSTTGNGSEKVTSAEKSEPAYKALLRKTKSSRLADDERSVASMGALDKRKKKATASSSRFNRDSTAAGGGGRGGDLTGISTKNKWSKKKYGGGGGGDYDDRSVASMGALSKRKQQYDSVATSSSTLGKINMGGLTGFSSKNGTSATKGGDGGNGKKWPPVLLKKQVGAKEQQIAPKNVIRKEDKKPDDDDNNNNNKEEPAYLVALKKAKGGGDANEQQSKKAPKVGNKTVSEKSIDEEPAYKIALRKATTREGNRNEKNPSARNLASAAKPSTTTKFGSFKNVSKQEKSSTEKSAPSYKVRTAEQTCETTSSSPAERKVPEGPDACAKTSNSPVIQHFELPKKTSPTVPSVATDQSVPSVATDQSVEENNKATKPVPHSIDNSTREEMSGDVEKTITCQDVPLPEDEDTDVLVQKDCDPNETPVDTLPSQQLVIDEMTEKTDTNQFDYADNGEMPPHEPADSVNGDIPNIGRPQPQPHDNSGDCCPAETVPVEKSKAEESAETALSEAEQMAMKQQLHPNETKAQQRARRRRERESFKGLKRFLLGRKTSKKSLHN